MTGSDDHDDDDPPGDNVTLLHPEDQGALLVAHAEAYLDQIKATIALENPAFILSDVFVDHWLRCERLVKDPVFSAHAALMDVMKRTAEVIKGIKWEIGFKQRVKSRKVENDALAKARAAELRGQVKRYRYDECPPNEYASYDKDGLPHASFLNAQLAFRDLGVTASFNLLNEKKSCLYKGSEIDVGTLRNMMLDLLYVDFPKRVIEEAIDAYCKRFAFHPILDYFESIRHLEYKGIIDTWLTKTVGAIDNSLNKEIGKKMLLAMVARMYKPGAKFDQMIVLEGLQGAGKSTLLEVLAGTEYFNSGKILSMSSKEQMEALSGRWIYESADLVGHGRTDVDAVKAFLSATSDNGRWAYAAEVKDRRRTAIIVGTTNRDNYLLDETGNRRIWPVACCAVPTDAVYEGVRCPAEIDLNWLRGNRDQLFREALQLYEDGYSLVLPRNMWPEIAAVQETRMAEVPGTETVADVWGFSEHEGLRIIDDKQKWYIRLEIWSQDIVNQLYPNAIGNNATGRMVRAAMNASRCNGMKWTYSRTINHKSLNRAGYFFETIGDELSYKKVIELIEDTRGYRRRRDGITEARM